MKNRKITLITLTALLLASLFVITVAAAGAVATTDGKTCEKGNTVTLQVDLSEVSDVYSGAVEVKYDSNVLELVDTDWLVKNEALKHFDKATNKGAFTYDTERTVGGKIFSVTFKVLDSASIGKSAVECIIQLKNEKGDSISVTNTPGYVDVLCTHDFSVKGDQHLASGATCTAPAKYYYSCSICGEVGETTYESGSAIGHSAKEAVQENLVPSTCEAEGSYDEVIYCSVCNEKLSTTKQTIEKIPHTFDKKVVTSDYLVAEVKCQDEAAYYYSCSCGAKGTETFTTPAEWSHNYSDGWYFDRNSHWHECSDCGSKKDEAAHTLDDKNFCSGCNCQIPVEEPHEHSFGEELHSDENGHWHECSCGLKSDVEAHQWSEGKCTVCEAEDPDYNPNPPTEDPEEKPDDNSSSNIWEIIINFFNYLLDNIALLILVIIGVIVILALLVVFFDDMRY